MLSHMLRAAGRQKTGLQFVGGSATTSGSAVDSFAYPLTGLSGGIDTQVRVGDLAVIVLSLGRTSSNLGIASGQGLEQAELYTDSPSDYMSNVAIWTRTFSTQESAWTFVTEDSTAIIWTAAMHVWRNAAVSGSSPITTNTGGDSPPDAPITSTAPVDDSVVIALGGSTFGTSGTNFTVPSGMTNFFQYVQGSATCGACIASVSIINGGTNYDPAAFGGSSSANRWGAGTLKIIKN